MKSTGVLVILMLCIMSLSAQQKKSVKNAVRLPDIPGYKTLKCDFHMHTVFSDGHVWPTFRVNEAVRDGLDAISLTEHIDYEGFPDEIERNYNRSYEIASTAAKKSNLLVIKGVEISPRVPPYHNNALFVKDANILPIGYMKSGKKKFVMQDAPTKSQLMAPFLEAKKQDAFVFYNHPGYSWWDKKDTNIFTTFHKELLDKNILKGVEVVNSGRYNIIAHRLAMKYNLTMVCNTDEHYDMYPRYQDTHRPMTLVFSKDRSVEGIREALEAKRTALYFDDYIIARTAEAEEFFKASLDINSEYKTRNGEKIVVIRIFNKSSVPYRVRFTSDHDIENYPLGQVDITPGDTTDLILKTVWRKPEQMKVGVTVNNILISPEEPLQTELVVSPQEIIATDSLTVMTYNIHHANPPSISDSIDIDAIARVIVQQRPDLVALQEVDVHTGRSGKNIDQAAALAQKTGMRYYFAKAIDHDGGDYGVAILSRYPITNPQTHRLPVVPGSGGEPRVLATTVIEISPQQKILFASTHLDAQRNDTNRLLQIRALTEILKKEKFPVVIGGDFNAEPSSRVVNILDEQFVRTCVDSCDFTIPVLKPSKTIDYIAYSRGSSFKVIKHRVIPERYASDHLPVVAVFELKR